MSAWSAEADIVASGVQGRVFLCGATGDDVPEETVLKLRERAGGEPGRWIVLSFGEKAGDGTRLGERLGAERLVCVDREAVGAAMGKLREAEGIWVTGGTVEQGVKLVDGTGIDAVLREARAAVLSGALVELASTALKAGGEIKEGLNLVPDSVVAWAAESRGAQERIDGILKERPGLVGYEVEAGEVMWVEGRRLRALGGGIGVQLSGGATREAVRRVLSEESPMDLTALRREARVRAGEAFPPEHPEAPVVRRGTLMIAGGGPMPEGLMTRFVKLAGGRKGNVVVLPTAAPDPLPEQIGVTEAFRRAGAGTVTVLRGRLREEVESESSLEALKAATGIWFGGGRQWRFVDAYAGTKAEALMHAVLERGGVIGGSSAGASIQAEYLARGNPLGNREIMAEGYERGLGFLKGVAIDQHFSKRNRDPDMRSLVERYPQLLGIGVDEGTALVVQGRYGEVVGREKVFFYDGKGGEQTEAGPRVDAVESGSFYDLVSRREVSGEEIAASRDAARRGPAEMYARALRWRPVGPGSMGGRIVDIEVVPSNSSTYYVGTAAGGIFKTVNSGVTFEPVFDQAGSLSIGDICVAPSDPRVVWVGTGEPNGRNSVSWGDGVYRSTDGGRTWRHVGLEKTFQIGRVLVHPKDPDVAWVGAVGRLWGRSEERGIYKTTDGGGSWRKVMHVDDGTGCIDMAMSPTDPEVMLAAFYERERDAFDGGAPAKRWGAGSGLYKSEDGGESWRRLTNGLPDVQMGRIGIAWSTSEPARVFAVVESELVGRGDPEEANRPQPAFMGISGGETKGDKEGAVLGQIIADGPAENAGFKPGDVVYAVEGNAIKSYEDLIGQIREHVEGDTVRMNVRREGKEMELDLTYGARPVRGNRERPYVASQGGQEPNIQDKQGSDGYRTGGVFRSDDRGETWERINSLAPRPFYYSKLRVDPENVDMLFVLGISVHRSEDGGKSFEQVSRGIHSDHHAMWIDPADGRHILLGSDGGLYSSHDGGTTWEFLHNLPIGQFYHVTVDNRPLYHIYGGLQDNGSWGGPSAMRGTRGPTATDWFQIGGGDGFVCQVDAEDPDTVYYELQWGRISRLDLRTGRRSGIAPRREEGKRFRFGWKTPFVLSHHNSRILYAAGNYLFRSLNQGRDLRRVSPRLTVREESSATALSESPRDSEVLYVGTDDGQLWVTRDGGREWENITESLSVSGPRRVSSIEASRYRAGRVYVTLDGHFYDDDAAHVLVSDDYGRTFQSLRANLPETSVKVLREDLRSGEVLYLGTEFGAWLSVNRGASWSRLTNNLPAVPVYEFAQHEASGELIAGTHGRGIWILDVAPLRQLDTGVMAAAAHLYRPNEATLWAGALSRSERGAKHYFGENPARGASIYYHLLEPVKEARLRVVDFEGETVRELKAGGSVGVHRIGWDLRRASSGGRGRRLGPIAEPGRYRVVLELGERELAQTLAVAVDPELPEAITALEMEELEEMSGEESDDVDVEVTGQ